MTPPASILKTHLASLLLTKVGPTEAQIAHREGRIRGLFFALTGQDIGYGCGTRPNVERICHVLGWGFKPSGLDGWEIDWHGEADEADLARLGVEIVP